MGINRTNNSIYSTNKLQRRERERERDGVGRERGRREEGGERKGKRRRI